MFKNWLNVRIFVAVMAIVIAIATILYSRYLAEKLAVQERQKMEIWVEAQKSILTSSDNSTINLAARISSENTNIPIIETTENDVITGNYMNLDSLSARNDKDYLPQKLKLFKQQHQPIKTVISQQPYIANKYYYGDSLLLKQIKYFPIIQLIIVALLIVFIIALLQTHYRSEQNKLWAGLAKETAHQLGTPVTSLQGWVEVLKEQNVNENIPYELEKDVHRLQLITDRFGKIGSVPKLEEKNINEQIVLMAGYMKKRSGMNVEFIINEKVKNITTLISPPLFDWVIENLIKNALDAMNGKGKLIFDIDEDEHRVLIDVSDTGKGIASAELNKIFNPGFSTKKRGWGLGLTLAKRIIEQYHHGKIYVLSSEINKGTTFRILLKQCENKKI